MLDKLHTFFFAGSLVCFAAFVISDQLWFLGLQFTLGAGQFICSRIIRGKWIWQ